MRLMVESWPETLYMDSSSADVCSGEVPCLLGSSARASFSTYDARRYKEEVSKWQITAISGVMVTISEQCPHVLTKPPHGESEQKGEG